MNSPRKSTIITLGIFTALAVALDYNLIIGVFGLPLAVAASIASAAAAAWLSTIRQPDQPGE